MIIAKVALFTLHYEERKMRMPLKALSMGRQQTKKLKNMDEQIGVHLSFAPVVQLKGRCRQ